MAISLPTRMDEHSVENSVLCLCAHHACSPLLQRFLHEEEQCSARSDMSFLFGCDLHLSGLNVDLNLESSVLLPIVAAFCQCFLSRMVEDIPVQYQSPAPQGGNAKDDGTKQIVLGLSKQYTHKKGWEAAELASRVAARRWLQHRAGVEVFDVRPPTRIVGREELQVVARIASSTYDGPLRASGTDGAVTRPVYTTEEANIPSRMGCNSTARCCGGRLGTGITQ